MKKDNDQLFLDLCKKYEDKILLLVECKVFEIKNGKITIPTGSGKWERKKIKIEYTP